MHALVKLFNGEEVMGLVEEDLEEIIEIRHPVQLHRTINHTGHTWIACSDYLMFCEGDTLQFKRSDCVFIRYDLTKPVVDNYEKYLQQCITEHEVIDDEERQREIAMLAAGLRGETYH
jgi:Holliday junction resolvase RusA-like endonuclease